MWMQRAFAKDNKCVRLLSSIVQLLAHSRGLVVHPYAETLMMAVVAMRYEFIRISNEHAVNCFCAALDRVRIIS